MKSPELVFACCNQINFAEQIGEVFDPVYPSMLLYYVHDSHGYFLLLMPKSGPAKMGIKERARAIFINAPADTIAAIELPTLDPETNLTGNFDYIRLLTNSQKKFHEHFPKLKGHLKPMGTL